MKLKSQFYILITLLFCVGCDRSTDDPLLADESLLVGIWKETEAFISEGGPPYWVDVGDGEELAFFENGMFSSDRYAECATGNFSVVENELRLEYTCSGFSTPSENEAGFITYDLEIYSDYFILTPTSGPICFEGCRYKYQLKN